MNSFGTIFRLTTFGESHGAAIGGVIDGVPAGVAIDVERVQRELDRRRPGQSRLTTSRRESDTVRLLSGIMNGVSLGTPIGFVIENEDHHSDDYQQLASAFRPSHADYAYTAKYGLRDHRGGGRSSARETAARVVGGAIARQVLETVGVDVYAYTSAVGPVTLQGGYEQQDRRLIDSNPARCPDEAVAARMIEVIDAARRDGDTVGGVVTGVITGVPAGLGEPVFDKLQARLAAAMMSINAAKGFDYGMGFAGCRKRGSEVNDPFMIDSATGRVTTATNHSGGIQGGISIGTDIYFNVAFKPVATLMRPVETIDNEGNKIVLEPRGRHDPCVLPRAVPVVEAMAAMTILDMLLINRSRRL
ncbi:MAG: chorismate synthase [Muribaculaceae bacterium]|nr:chorismate synthase [Muribaculaceae bacterium]